MNLCSERIILTDVDDTLLKFDEGFTRWMIAKGYQMTIDPDDAPTIEIIFGIESQQAIDLIMEFYHTEEFSRLEPLPCAAEVLPQLYERGYRFVAISACANEPQIKEARKKNLRDAFGFDFEDVILTGLFVPRGKDPILARYERTVWVEDNEEHAQSGCQWHNSLLINRKRNETYQHDKVTKVKDWQEISRLLDTDRLDDHA